MSKLPSKKSQVPAEKKSWRDVLLIHPAAKLFEPLPDSDLKALGEDIKKNGLREPITLWFSDPDGESNEPELLDGVNRMNAMEAEGIAVVRDEWRGGGIHQLLVAWKGLYPPNNPYTYARSANVLRRHLTAESRRKSIADLIKADPSKSDRRIAEQTKASPSTVGKVRQQLEGTGEVSKLDTRTDKKGVKQPAAKPAHVTAAVDRAVARSEENQRRQAAGNDCDPQETAARRKAETQTAPPIVKDENAWIGAAVWEIERAIAKLPPPAEAAANFPACDRHTITVQKLRAMVDWLSAFAAAWEGAA
jgi:hypothetical protein